MREDENVSCGVAELHLSRQRALVAGLGVTPMLETFCPLPAKLS